MRKRIASIVLSVCLCLTLLPTAALADEGGSALSTTHDCTTEGHIDTDNDNKCDACSIGITASGVWVNWKDDGDHTQGEDGEGTWLFAADGTLTVSGTGRMAEYQNYADVPWNDFNASVKKIVIREGVTSVGLFAFFECINATEVILPDSLTEIQTAAFRSCNALTTIHIPKNVGTIGEAAFDGCAKLKAFEVDGNNSHFFSEGGVLFQKNTDESGAATNTLTLICYPGGKTGTSYTIPNQVTEIQVGAFNSADRLTEISFPASLTTFTPSEFASCLKLTTITVDESNSTYQSINGVLFSKDGETLFCYPTGKTDRSYRIPDGVTEIAECAFQNAVSLVNVVIPEGVTNIELNSFGTCHALSEVNIPASVTYIGEDAFSGCISLTAIHVAEENTAYKDIDGVLFSYDGTTLYLCPVMKTGNYTIPTGVTTIKNMAFHQSKLTSVTIPDGVTTIGMYAFQSAEKLVSVSLPKSVTEIGVLSFKECPVLKNVYFAGDTDQWEKMEIPNKDAYGLADTNSGLGIENSSIVKCDFDEIVTITLNPNGGSLPDDAQTSWTVPYNTASSYTPPTPTRGEDSFVGWYYSAEIYNEYTQTVSTTSRVWNWADPVYQDMELTAMWSRPGNASYSVTLPKTIENGTIKSSHRHAEEGELVTLTVTPEEGYTLEMLTVTDRNGKEIEVKDLGNGKYSFKMPASKVTVNATFEPEKTVTDYFADVPADSYYADAVLWAAKSGVTGGIGNGLFAPNETCTRAQIVAFLWRVAGSPVPKAASSFTDVPDNAYYAKAVAWAVENGITGGIGNSLFAPDQTCTRAQAVAFLFRYAASQGMDAVTLQELVSSYGDAAQIPGYALSAFNWALANGIATGNNGNLMPNDDCTRAQIVTMLYRLLGA